MLSRVAERIYWAGRYLERAENTARLVNTYANLLLDLPEETGVTWSQLLKIVALDDLYAERHRKAKEEKVLRFLLVDERNPGSILSSLREARENVRTTRDVVPTEVWESVNEFYLMGQHQLARAVARRRRFEVLSDCVTRSQQITGLLSGTMSHDQAYQFLRLGNHIERADMTTRVVDAGAATLAYGKKSILHYENTLWMTVLRALSGYQMYRRHVRRRIRGQDVIEFLLTDAEFPRSVMHALNAIEGYSATLPHREPTHDVLHRLRSGLEGGRATADEGESLRRYVDDLQRGFAEVHRTIEATWFRHGDEEEASSEASTSPDPR